MVNRFTFRRKNWQNENFNNGISIDEFGSKYTGVTSSCSGIPWRSSLISSIVISITEWAAQFISLLSIASSTSVTRVPVANARVLAQNVCSCVYLYVETHVSRTEYGSSIEWTILALQAAHIHLLKRESKIIIWWGFRFSPNQSVGWFIILIGEWRLAIDIWSCFCIYRWMCISKGGFRSTIVFTLDRFYIEIEIHMNNCVGTKLHGIKSKKPWLKISEDTYALILHETLNCIHAQ